MANKLQAAGTKLHEKLHNLKELLIQFIFRNSIGQKLEEIADQLDKALENGDLMQDDIEKLTKIVDSLAGSLRNTSPEQMKKTEEEAENFINAYIETLYKNGKITDAKVNEPDFYNAVRNLSPKFKDMSEKEFKEYFNKNAVILNSGNLKTKDGAVEGTTSALAELDGECYEITFNVSEPKVKDENQPDKKERSIVMEVAKYNGSYSDFKPLEQNSEGAYETMMRAFLKPRDLHRKEDIRKYDIKKLAKENQAVHDITIVNKFKDKVIETEDKRAEITYDSETNVFIARDKETNEALTISVEKNEVHLSCLKDLKDINDWKARADELSTEGENKWIYNKGTGKIKYNLQFTDNVQSKILHQPEFLEILSTKGVEPQGMLSSIDRRNDTKPIGFSKTEDATALERVDRLKDALDDVIRLRGRENTNDIAINDNRRYAWKNKNAKTDKAAVFLSIEDKKSDYILSFNLDRNGEPVRLNYSKKLRDKDGNYLRDFKGKIKTTKFRFVENFQLHENGMDYHELSKDPDFMKLYNIACESRDLYRSREDIIENAIQKDNKSSNKNTEQPFEFDMNTFTSASPDEFDNNLRKAHGNNITSYSIHRLYEDVTIESGRVLLGEKPNIDLRDYDKKFLNDFAKTVKTDDPTTWINNYIEKNKATAATSLESELTGKLLSRLDRGTYNRAKSMFSGLAINKYEHFHKNRNTVDNEPVKEESHISDMSQVSKETKDMLVILDKTDRDDVSKAYIKRQLDVDADTAEKVYSQLRDIGVVNKDGEINAEKLEQAIVENGIVIETEITDEEIISSEPISDIDDKE